VTAVSGSGPAYVFYFIEALERAGLKLGLGPEISARLAIATFDGATRLARQSDEPLQILRERVTSKGGTTHRALTELEGARVSASIVDAVQAAALRARELGDEFGRD
jgi:pyrroline-5-carboxylate reductase